LVFWIIIYFFLLTIFFYMLYNSKWFELFKPLKFLHYVITKNAKKLSFLLQVPNFWIFFTHVTVWCCSTLVWEDVKRIQKFPPCRLHDISLSSDKNPDNCTSQGQIIMKKCPKWLQPLVRIILQGKLVACKKIQIIWNCTTYRKKIVRRKM